MLKSSSVPPVIQKKPLTTLSSHIIKDTKEKKNSKDIVKTVVDDARGFVITLDGADRGLVRIHPNSRRLRMQGGKVISKWCHRCLDFRDINLFAITKAKTYSPLCAYCLIDLMSDTRGKGRPAVKTRRDKDGILQYKCSKCKRYKYDIDFPRRINNHPWVPPDKRHYHCKSCHSKYYQQSKRKTNGRAVQRTV